MRRKEATRDGAPPIDLIDGDLLCELLKKYDLGVHTATPVQASASSLLICCIRRRTRSAAALPL